MHVGERLRVLRRGQGLTIRNVALSAGITVPYLSRIETTKECPPSGKLLRRLCSVLGCEAELPKLFELREASRELSTVREGFPRMYFGKRIRMLRQRHGSTMNAVCKAVEMSLSSLHEIERGMSNPPGPEVIKRFCSVLDCETELPKLLELARGPLPRESFVMKADMRTNPEVRQMLGLLQRSHAKGSILPRHARAIATILEGETTPS